MESRTGLAILVDSPDFSDEGGSSWIPYSQIDRDQSEVNEIGDFGTLVVTEWLAEERGWI